MEEKIARRLSVACAVLVIVVILLGFYIFPAELLERKWLGFLTSFLAGLTASAITFLVSLWVFRKNFIHEHHSSSQLQIKKGNGEGESDEFEDSLRMMSELGDYLRDSQVRWDRYRFALDGLFGQWIQYIPDRLDQECPFTIVEFHVEGLRGPTYSGISYMLDGSVNYEFNSIKLIAPVEDRKRGEDLLHFYYIYIRDESDHGFGRVSAEKVGEKYRFKTGFFFNEASVRKIPENDERYSKCYFFGLEPLSSCENLEDDLDSNWGRSKLFNYLIKTGIAQKWLE